MIQVWQVCFIDPSQEMDTPHISTYDTGTSGVKSVSDLENCKHLKCPQGLHCSWDIICKPCKEC